MILSRLVNPRASRIADIVASVPELHIRTFSTLGTAWRMSFAIVTSNGFGMPKLVPCSAVLRTGDRNVVFIDMGDGELRPNDVELGRSAGDYIEVLAGLEPGQRVVTSAQFLLDSESNLADVMKGMMSQMSSGDLNKLKKPAGDENMKDMPGMTMPAKR